jgi:hypothetical protein
MIKMFEDLIINIEPIAMFDDYKFICEFVDAIKSEPIDNYSGNIRLYAFPLKYYLSRWDIPAGVARKLKHENEDGGYTEEDRVNNNYDYRMQTIGENFGDARKYMKHAFENDPELMFSYLSNIAMYLLDNLEISVKQEYDVSTKIKFTPKNQHHLCNKIAKALMISIFDIEKFEIPDMDAEWEFLNKSIQEI